MAGGGNRAGFGWVAALLALSACNNTPITTTESSDIDDLACLPAAELCNLKDDDCDGAIDEGVTNDCGGCSALDPAPLTSCGQCGGGTVICATPEQTLCVDATPPNACGGCDVLPREPGAACGTCDTGTLVCDGDNAITCEGAAGEEVRNACGGCLELDRVVGDPCGTCDQGVIACDGTEAARCVDDPGDDALNVCGLCGPVPEGGCEVCGDGVRIDGEECDDGNQEDNDGCASDCTLEAAWVRVEPDIFVMGSPDGELGRRSDERLHQVTISRPFLLRAHEVTRQEWEAIMGTPAPSLFEDCGELCPVSRVSWWDAVTFINRLSQQAGLTPCYVLEGCEGEPGGGCSPLEISCSGGYFCRDVAFVGLSCDGYRLPTEAEWEFAARAGTATAFSSGDLVHTSRSPLDPNLNAVGWYAGNSSVDYPDGQDCADWFDGASTCGPQPVGNKLPNAWGLFDMHGNVWEWVHDLGGLYPDDEVLIDPLGPEEGDTRTRRGGSWSSPSQFCRSAFRFSNDPSFRSNGLGFRVARTVLQ